MQAGQAGHGDVEDGQVGLVDAGRFDGFSAVAGFGHDGEVGFAVENEADSTADQRVIVGEKDAGFGDLGHGQWLRWEVGTFRRTSVPPSGAAPRERPAADEQGAFTHAADLRLLQERR